MLRPKRAKDVEKDEEERVTIRREPMPTSRAILWKPLPDSYHLLASMMRASEQQMQLFVTQRAFLQVERHLASGPDLELGGFLAGHLYQCPRARTRYSIVNTIIPFADVTGDPIGVRVTEKAYKAVKTRLDAHGLVLMGWYRSGAGLGLQLLPDDIETHLAYFEQPWETAILILPDPLKPRGAFFTYDPRVGRGYCVPFYELFDTTGSKTERMARTCVTWKTYVPSMPVQPMAAEDREIVETTVRPVRLQPDPEPPEPLDEWIDAIKDPWVRLKDVAVSAARREDEPLGVVWRPTSRSEDGSPAAPLQLPARTSPTPVEAPRVVEPPTAVAPASAPPAPNGATKTAPRPLPPFVGPARPAAQAAPSPQVAPRAPAPERAPAPKAPPAAHANGASVAAPAPPRALPPPAAPSNGASAAPKTAAAPARRPTPKPRPIPAKTVAALERAAATPPAVALPPDFHEEALRWQRRRRIGFAIAAASFLSVIALSSLRPRPQQIAQAATGDTTTSAVAAAIVAAPSENGHVPPLSLPVAVDSLTTAIAFYRSVDDDHRRGLVGCRVLDRAHDRVVRARAGVDASRGHVTGGLHVADSLRVSMVGAEYTHVAQMYRRSGCSAG
jgi:hypothetical protein